MPSGFVAREAYDYLTGRILDALRTRGPFDAALLDLHGAMVPEGLDDGEGPLLARMRAIAPDLPIAVTFDPHGNMTPRSSRTPTWSSPTRPIRMSTCTSQACRPGGSWSTRWPAR